MSAETNSATTTGGGTTRSYPVFISYARKESREQAQALHQALGGADGLAFLDESDIEPGERFPERLADALLGAQVVVIFATEMYFRRWYCLWELEALLAPFRSLRPDASEREKESALGHLVIALPPQGAPVPDLSSLPPRLRDVNWLKADEASGLAAMARARLSPGAPTLGQRLETEGELSKQLRFRLLEETALPPPKNLAKTRCYPHDLVPSLEDSFVGRVDDLWRIHHVLSFLWDRRGKGTAGAALTGAVLGTGGFGKTRLAVEYLHRFGPSYFPGGLFWVNADVNEDQLEDQFHGILSTLKPEIPDVVTFRKNGRNAAKELAGALDEVSAEERVLYVVDNVPEAGPGERPKPLGTWCPAIGKVALLFTSRALSLGREKVHGLPISTLARGAAVALLTNGTDRQVLDEHAWSQLAEWVGNLPLALELLNATMQVGSLEPTELLLRMESRSLTQELDQRSEELQRHAPPGVYRGVTEAFSISYEKLSEPERKAARLIAWLAPEPIPMELLNAVGEEVASSRVRSALLSRHFVTRAERGMVPVFGLMHRVLADYLRAQSPEPRLELRQVCQALTKVMNTSACTDPKAWPLLEACRPHAKTVFDLLMKNAVASEENIEFVLGLNLGELLRVTGRLSAAREYQEEVLEASRRVLGEEHRDTLKTMNNLAVTLHEEGEFAVARLHQERVLEVSRRVLGEENPSTLTAMNNLAGTLLAQGEFGVARRYQEQVLSLSRRVLGDEHPDTLRAMNNLAGTLRAQGDFVAARGYQEQVLTVYRSALGDEHPDTLRAMTNLAGTLFNQGDLDAARLYHEQVLTVSQQVLGEEHPDTFSSMANLAETLRAQGMFLAARRYQDRALQARRQVLGEEHPETLTLMANLAITLSSQGDLASAREYQERVLEVNRRVRGEEHPETLRTMNSLAGTLFAQGDFGSARRYHEQVLTVSQRVLGEEHPHTLTSMNNLARVLMVQGDLAAARTCLERVLKVSRQVLGEEHPNTLTSMNNLAMTLHAQGSFAAARRYLKSVVEVSRRVLGEEHPLTQKAAANLAAI